MASFFKECKLKYTLTVLEYGANSFSQALVIAWLMSLRWKITSETSFGGILVIQSGLWSPVIVWWFTGERRHVTAHDLKPLVPEVITGDLLHDGPSECRVARRKMATSLIGARILSWTVSRSVVLFSKFISFSWFFFS